jgi:hypothetical protein
LADVLDEWSGDDVDELFELLETQLGEVGIDLKTDAKATPGDEESDSDSDDAEPEEDEDEDEDDDEDEEEDEEEDDEA